MKKNKNISLKLWADVWDFEIEINGEIFINPSPSSLKRIEQLLNSKDVKIKIQDGTPPLILMAVKK